MRSLLILGLSALVAPLIVSSQLVRFDVPLMIGASLLMLALAWDGVVGRVDSSVLCSGLVAYIVWSVWQSRRESAAGAPEADLQRRVHHVAGSHLP